MQNCFNYYQEVKRYVKLESVTEQQVFFEVYYSLIYSFVFDTFFNFEYIYVFIIEDLIQQRDKDFEYLDDR